MGPPASWALPLRCIRLMEQSPLPARRVAGVGSGFSVVLAFLLFYVGRLPLHCSTPGRQQLREKQRTF
ncbi:hypothetical protein NDU88_004404 [Pleurodeles waltl]|uniref:Uncharacterized protein n=1 Tax=Pleurodeles waltl TaxID=8319 RepID=A0AAV7VIN0_PLEWA|nr:hypothetical protein NDU88_004404 [Pleurodeles waltl]